MEEGKAAAYFDDLTRRGEGAARFKQGLGFSAGSSSSSSFVKASGSFSLSNFVAASRVQTEADIEKECRIERIQNKLRRKDSVSDGSRGVSERQRRSESRDSEARSEASRRQKRSRSRSYSSGEENGHGRHDRRHRLDHRASKDRRKEKERSSEESRMQRRRSRSRSYSPERESTHRRSEYSRRNGTSESHHRSRDYSASREGRRRSHSSSPREKKKPETRRIDGKGDIDYSRLIEGYDKMTPAERVKAKMRLQLSQTVSKESRRGMSKEWERFDFNKDAPLDDEDLEGSAEEDDSGLLKDVGRNFRFSAVEASREAANQAAHDEAIFGVPTAGPVLAGEVSDNDISSPEQYKDTTDAKKVESKNNLSSVMSEKVLALQQGSWRDRARKLQNG